MSRRKRWRIITGSVRKMLDGLGLAETTPGPLIMLLQFVGFLGAWNHPGNLRKEPLKT